MGKTSKKDAERKRLKKFQCPEQDTLNTTGVLLSDEIEFYANKYQLIFPFSHDNLKPSSYRLTIGDEYSVGGEARHLTDEPGDMIKIPPFEVAVIKTAETLNLPRFIIGRWNIRVDLAYEGLLWVGGPQVSAGYVGNLFCPIYNLSDKEVNLRIGDTIAIIDFVKTTPFTKGKCLEYPRPPPNMVFSDYRPEQLKSALITEAKTRIARVENEVQTSVKDLKERVDTFGQRLDTSVGTIIAIIAILVAALSIFVSSREIVSVTVPWWFYLAVIFSMVSLVLSIFAYTRTKSVRHA